MRLTHSAFLSLLFLTTSALFGASEAKNGQSNWQRSVVRVEVTRKQYDVGSPGTELEFAL